MATWLALIRRLGGRAQAERAINRVAGAFKPVTIAGLLATLVIVFVFQGALIGSKALHILLIAVPMTLSTVLVWCTVYLVGSGLLSMPHVLLAPAALIATSNFFELAIAVAVSITINVDITNAFTINHHHHHRHRHHHHHRPHHRRHQ